MMAFPHGDNGHKKDWDLKLPNIGWMHMDAFGIKRQVIALRRDAQDFILNWLHRCGSTEKYTEHGQF